MSTLNLKRLPPHARRAALLAGNKVWQAMNTKPMPQPEQVDLVIAAESAFEEIRHGRGVEDHLETLAVAANVSMVLAERGFGAECEDKIRTAQHAIRRAGQRRMRGHSIGFDGPGMQAVIDLLDTHTQQVEHAGRAELSTAMLEVHNRISNGHVLRDEQPGATA